MRIHTPTPRPRESGDFPVHVNPGGSDGEPFATIELSEDWATQICLDSLGDADRLIRAAVDAKRKMSAAIAGQRHEFAPDELAASWCAACGLTRGNAIHDVPDAAAVLAASIGAGTPLVTDVITDDAPDCASCGRPADEHDEYGMIFGRCDAYWDGDTGEPERSAAWLTANPPPFSRDLSGDLMAAAPDDAAGAGTNRPDDPGGHAARASLRTAPEHAPARYYESDADIAREGLADAIEAARGHDRYPLPARASLRIAGGAS